MSQYEMNLASAATAGQPTNWPHNQLQHPAVHTPIQAYANGQLGLSVPNAASPYAPQTFNQQTTLINGSRPYTDQQKMAIMAAAQQRERLQQNPIPQLVTSQFGSGMQQNYLDGLDIDRQKLLWPQQQVQQQQTQAPQQISENWFDSKPWNQTIVQASPQAQSIQLPNFSQISNSQPMNVMSFNSPPRQQQQMMEPPRNFIGNVQSNGPNPISSQPQMLPQQQQVYQQTSSPFVNTSQPNGFCSVTPVASVNASPAPSRTSVTPGSGFVSPRPPTRSSRPASSSTPVKEELDIMGVQEGHGSETTGHNEGTMDTQEENEGKSIVRPRLHSMDTQEEHEGNSIVRPRLHSILDYDPEPMDETPKQNEEQDSSNHGSNHGNLNEDEASRLLLSFSQSLPTMPEHNQLAALRIEERIRLEASQSSSQDPENGPTQADPSNIPSSTPNTNHVQEIVTSSPSTSNTPTTQTTTNRGFFRAPGLGPLEISDTLQNSIDKKEVFTCPVCGFSCGSKFHFQSHMNTHGDHRCSICNYTCRTEGRLKKHQREGHSLEQLVAAGIDISFSQQQQQQNPSTTENSIPTTPSEINVTSPSADLSSTMASLIDAANRAAAARREATVADIVESVASQTHVSSSPQLSQSLLQIAPSPSSVSNSVITSSSIQPSPLDQIRALNSSLLPSVTLGGNSSLATALGLFSLPNGGADNMSDIDMNPDSVNPSRDGPRRSSGGKPKSYKCKQCNHVSMSKEESWQHARLHIPPEKQLVCKQCDFVTEYKHHLEYHLRNHYGSKPFKCSKCAYACVNKSMLNSHMKSHSNAYQFQCMDCNYQSKYCHSLKMHLRKYNHRRKPGGAPMTDDNEDELMMLDEQTQQALQQQLNEQFNLQPGGPVMGSDISKPIATTLSSMLLQPIVTSSSLQYAFMRQQQHQVEQMNAIIRAANPLACNLCDFRTSTNEELGRHIVDHIAANQEAAALQQPSLANLYQNLIQSMPQLLPGTPPQLPAPQPRPPSTTASATATITVGPTINGSNMPPMGFQGASLAQLQQDALLRLQQSQEIQPRSGAESLKMDAQGTEIEDEHHHRFTPDDGSGHDESVNSSGEGSSTSPGGSKGSRTSSYSGDIHGGSKKRKGKALKLEQISQRLQDKRSPDGVQRAETSATDDTGVTTTTSSSSILPSMSVENVTASNLDQVVTEVRLLQERCRQLLRHTCDHCEISFKDLPLYKIHSGYHSIENPFKCNHCGFLANDSLGFNLHLLQERH